jgi:hypothetical protein
VKGRNTGGNIELRGRVQSQHGSSNLGLTARRGGLRRDWSTYKALSAGVVQPEDVRVYEQEIHQAISEMVSSQMRIAALDDALFRRVTPLISEAIRMEGDTFLELSAATQDLSKTGGRNFWPNFCPPEVVSADLSPSNLAQDAASAVA